MKTSDISRPSSKKVKLPAASEGFLPYYTSPESELEPWLFPYVSYFYFSTLSRGHKWAWRSGHGARNAPYPNGTHPHHRLQLSSAPLDKLF
ncbi:uncharacterized [Tachysurus ichikawai]